MRAGNGGFRPQVRLEAHHPDAPTIHASVDYVDQVLLDTPQMSV
jgi:hypothetical protein